MNQLTLVVYVRQTNAGHREHGYTLYEGVDLVRVGGGYGPESAAHADVAKWLLDTGRVSLAPKGSTSTLGNLCREQGIPFLEITFSGAKASEIKAIQKLKVKNP